MQLRLLWSTMSKVKDSVKENDQLHLFHKKTGEIAHLLNWDNFT